ncbi:hypothetical protein [Rhodococcus sp. Q]|uniref:hypothetical protein n=1 Tax=Rhodococcus sp. Q TaxID=2502252 RepID=UPI0010F66DF2|nr:hypothetical protein [Rhodococcus sp. Q]
MASVRGQRFLVDPEGEAQRFTAQLQAEAAAASSDAPPPYVWQPGYWCAVKTGAWPNVTGWAESREAQRLFESKLAGLRADGSPKATKRAAAYAQAEMLARTTARKEASDRYYTQLDASTGDDTHPGGQHLATPPD